MRQAAVLRVRPYFFIVAGVALLLVTVLYAALASWTPHVHFAAPAPAPPAAAARRAATALVGDGKADDGAALQARLDAAPGGDVVLPKTRGPLQADYYSTRSLTLKGYGQTLRGACGGGQAGVRIKFAAGVSGIVLTNAAAQGACVRDLTLEGSERWDGPYPEQAVLTSRADGIKLGATNARVENVSVLGFGRHGVNVGDGQGVGYAADSFYLANLYLANNRGCGLCVRGGDSSGGTTVQVRAVANQLWGIDDGSFLGNTHISPLTDSNHLDNTPGQAAAAVWKAAGDAGTGGPYRSSGAVGNTWLKPYSEGNQGPSKFSPRDLVISPNLGGGWDEDSAPAFLATQLRGVNGFHLPPTTYSNGIDLQLNTEYRAGRTSAQNVFRRYSGPDGKALWAEVCGPEQGYQVWQGEPWGAGSKCRLWFDGVNGKVYLDGQDVLARLKALEAAAAR